MCMMMMMHAWIRWEWRISIMLIYIISKSSIAKERRLARVINMKIVCRLWGKGLKQQLLSEIDAFNSFYVTGFMQSQHIKKIISSLSSLQVHLRFNFMMIIFSLLVAEKWKMKNAAWRRKKMNNFLHLTSFISQHINLI